MFQRILDFVRFQLTAQSAFGIHSPFVYHFKTSILPHRASDVGIKIDLLRRQLCQNHTIIDLIDWGAGYGGKTQHKVSKKISDIAKSASRRHYGGELLYRICKYYKPTFCVELGTNLGISGLYQALGNPDAQFYSFEGDPTLAEIAAQHFSSFERKVKIEVGEFSETLPSFIAQNIGEIDYVFIDGNHRYAPTLSYFQQFLPAMKAGGIMIFDDIYWSSEMKQAWAEIKKHPDVSVSIDLYSFGICWIRKKQVKQDFQFRFWE